MTVLLKLKSLVLFNMVGNYFVISNMNQISLRTRLLGG